MITIVITFNAIIIDYIVTCLVHTIMSSQ